MAMKAQLDTLEGAMRGHRNFESPPLHLWNPDGEKIERDSLVRLFASILRREEDSEYYLVTPHEKWRIEVEHHPFLITDISAVTYADGQVLEARLNTGKRISIGEEHPLYLDERMGGVAAMHLPHQLTALCTRSVWYRLVAMADTTDGVVTLRSGNYELRLPTA
jgi:uncharacterized protein